MHEAILWRAADSSLNFSISADRARHDALVTLVEKMLSLVPKLRAETR